LSPGFEIIRDKQGVRGYVKLSCPVRYGRYHEIKTPEYVYHFHLNGEIRHIQGRGGNWPHPAEWLTRTLGNDWIYYSSGDYQGIFDLFGEYYVPIPSYPTNHILLEKPFSKPAVQSAIGSLDDLAGRAGELAPGCASGAERDFLATVAAFDSAALSLRGQACHRLIGGTVSVLPPDTRHVNYEVLPVILADGCLYNCSFCAVKSGDTFRVRDRQDVARQIRGLKEHLGPDVYNYNAVFLGGHDALHAGLELIEYAAGRAYEIFELQRSFLQGANLFLFGSVHSLLAADEGLFAALNRLPYTTWINIGLESADADTLKALGKPLSVADIQRAFARLVAINRRYEQIEISANFVISMELPPKHADSIVELTRNALPRFYGKGAIYLSPLMSETRGRRAGWREWLKKIHAMQIGSRLPCYLYLIQRL
jgi:hypothetical protein